MGNKKDSLLIAGVAFIALAVICIIGIVRMVFGG